MAGNSVNRQEAEHPRRERRREQSRRRSLLRLRSTQTAIPVIGAAGFILLAGGVFPGTSTVPADPRPAALLAVHTQVVQPASGYTVGREFVGHVEPHRQSQLGLELTGLLTAVHFDEGDVVNRGDVIASLDTQILETQKSAVAARLDGAQARLQEMLSGPRQELIDAARADVHQWQARLGLSEATLARQRELLERTASSKQEFDDAQFGRQAVAAQLASARARLAEMENGTREEQIATQRAAVRQLESELLTIEINLSKSELRAPFSGVVSRRFIDEGTVVSVGSPVIELMETGQLDVRVGVSEDALSVVRPGREFEVLINHRSYPAVARSIRPDRNSITRTVTVLMTLDSRGDLIHAGDLATLQLDDRIESPGFRVPLSALTESYRGLWGCYVAEPIPTPTDAVSSEYRLGLRELEIIHQTATTAFVRGSLSDGERIVVDGTHRLVANQRVRLADEQLAAMTSDKPGSARDLAGAGSL